MNWWENLTGGVAQAGTSAGTAIQGLLGGVLTPVSNLLGATTTTNVQKPVEEPKNNTTMFVLIGLGVVVVIVAAVFMLNKNKN